MSILAGTAQRVDDVVARLQARGRVPSLSVGVLRDGTLVHVSAAGEVPSPETQFRIGSVTKTFTAALVAQLSDEGLLSLDDPVTSHLPGAPVGGVCVRQLVAHVSGLQREPDGEWWERARGCDVDTLLAGLTPQKLALPPHDRHHYSNLAYGLLGAVLTRVTGEEWADLLTSRLLEPLELRRTTYHPRPPYARGYVVHPWYDTLREEPRHDAGAMAPAGQLWSTLADMAAWAGFLCDPPPAVLAPATLARMCAPVALADIDTWTAGHGLGIQLWRRGERVYIGHSGSMPGYLALLAVHRPSRTGVVAFANAYTMRGGFVTQLLGLLTEVLDREPPPRPPAWRAAPCPPPAQVAALCGRWWWMGQEYAASWDAHARELVVTPLAVPGAVPWRFAEEGPDRWRGRSGMNDGEVLQVRRTPEGDVAALDIATFVLTRRP